MDDDNINTNSDGTLDWSKVSNCGNVNIIIRPYDAVVTDLQSLSSIIARANEAFKQKQVDQLSNSKASSVKHCDKVWMDPSKCSIALKNAVTTHLCSSRVLELESPIALLKGIKNKTEIQGMKNAHIRDGVAVCKYISWLTTELAKQEKEAAAAAKAATQSTAVSSLQSVAAAAVQIPLSLCCMSLSAEGEEKLDELNAARKLAWFRSQQKDFMGLSFETISSSGPNGAVIHYAPSEQSKRPLVSSEMYLVDSGGQYRDGTTDITRTMHFGTPTEFERSSFTRVLQGHISLAAAVFPEGTTGPVLDVLARQHLWNVGLDYCHGTGHGIGHFLNVHEGPHGISASSMRPDILRTPLKVGMCISNEPGYYHDGHFGIRIENIVIVDKADLANTFQGKQFLKLNTITMVPFDRKLIDVKALTAREIQWIDQYHATVFKNIAPLLADDSSTLQWLKENCAPLQ
jgi:Xaa-Pro aminopeptidase